MNKGKRRLTGWFFILTLLMVSLSIGLSPRLASAIPVLQLGLSNDGGLTFVPYTTVGSDTDTAFGVYVPSVGFPLWIGGSYGPNVTSLDGGCYDCLSGGSGVGTRNNPVLIASVPEGSLGTGTVTVGGLTPFMTTTTRPVEFQNNHYPTGGSESDFLYFDVFPNPPSGGVFSNTTNGVRDFANTANVGNGQEFNVSVAITGFSRVHFDIVSIETSDLGRRIVSTIEENPGSHDVTMNPVPEPRTLLLLGTGLIGVAGFARRKFLARR